MSTGQPGPRTYVAVGPRGIDIIGLHRAIDPRTHSMMPGTARWIANRLLEATAIYEAVFGGDGSVPSTGAAPGTRPTLANGNPTEVPTGQLKWVCPCGKESSNKGAMSVHEKSCPYGPAHPVEA